MLRAAGAPPAPAWNQRMIRRDWKLNFGHLVTKGFAGCGPVIALELRAASRRRRTYWVRLAYVVLLTLYVAMVWVAVVSWADSGGAFTRSRMAAAGVSVGCGVMWFLVLAGPAAAVLLATNCFQEELHHGGLTLILGTPVGYPQIVAGKFLGRLAQMQVLLLAALPSLALVRVFGGVPAPFVIGSVLLALNWAMMVVAATAFVLGLGLLCSTVFRRTTTAMMLSAGCLGGLWLLGPMLAGLVEGILAEAAGLHTNWSSLAEEANPLCVIWASVPSVDGGHIGDQIAGFGGYRLGGLPMSAWTLARTVAGVTLAYLAAGAAMAWLAKSRFRRSVA